MTKQEKLQAIEDLKLILKDSNVLYIANTGKLNAKETSELRRSCFKNNISVKVVKNTLLEKAMKSSEEKDYNGIYGVLEGGSTIFTSESSNMPAKILKAFNKKNELIEFKAAWIDSSIYVGNTELDKLVNLKSKEELIAEIISLLQSPMKNILSALDSGKNKLTGVLKTLSNV